VRICVFVSWTRWFILSDNLIHRNLADGLDLATTHTATYKWVTDWPICTALWGLLAHAPAYTGLHADVNGQNTHVRIILGKKYWLVATNANLTVVREGCDEKTLKYQLVVLGPQDDLWVFSSRHFQWTSYDAHCRFMRPDTHHVVLTTKDSLAVGGHFFCSNTFGYTLRGIIKDHFFGTSWTNAEHAESGLVLFKLIKRYLDDVADGDWEDSGSESPFSLAPSDL
jgi:hypothetical protein